MVRVIQWILIRRRNDRIQAGKDIDFNRVKEDFTGTIG